MTALLGNLKLKAELIQVNSQVNICRDAKDNFLLSLAVDGAATHVLTGDKDLLVLHPFGQVQILTIADYLSDKYHERTTSVLPILGLDVGYLPVGRQVGLFVFIIIKSFSIELRLPGEGFSSAPPYAILVRCT